MNIRKIKREGTAFGKRFPPVATNILRWHFPSQSQKAKVVKCGHALSNRPSLWLERRLTGQKPPDWYGNVIQNLVLRKLQQLLSRHGGYDTAVTADGRAKRARPGISPPKTHTPDPRNQPSRKNR